MAELVKETVAFAGGLQTDSYCNSWWVDIRHGMVNQPMLANSSIEHIKKDTVPITK